MSSNISALTFAACIACTGATAATFDFEADATAFWNVGPSGDRYEGTFDQVYDPASARSIAAGTDGGNSVDGITVTASAMNANGVADPFMDSGQAGLGVCSFGFDSGISECSSNGGSNTGDDNLVDPEVLTLDFSLRVLLDGLKIRDAGHNLITSQADAIEINGDFYDTDASGQVILTGLGAATSFIFTSNGTGPGDEIYLSVLDASLSKVPLPAAGFLLLGALGGLGAMARRRKA